MKTILVVLISLLLLNEICSQNNKNRTLLNSGSIYGQVIDSLTNEPLVGANILISKTTKGSATNKNGQYEISKLEKGLYKIEASYIGYVKTIIDSIKINTNERKEINIALVNIFIVKEREWAKQADIDIKNGKIQILLGGLTVFCLPFDTVKMLTKKYGFEYRLMGCSFFVGDKYNEKMYKYLDSLNGKDWSEKFNNEYERLCKERNKF